MASQRRTFLRMLFPATSAPVLPLRAIELAVRDWRAPYERWALGPQGPWYPPRGLDGAPRAAYNGPVMSDEAPHGTPPTPEPEHHLPGAVEPAPAEAMTPEPSAHANGTEAAPLAQPEPPVAPVERKGQNARPKSRSEPKTAGRPALIAPTFIPIESLEPDEQFLLREVGDVAGLATSLARVGQLFPIDVRPRGGSYQVVAGFRRLAALRFLQRDKVLARIHEGLTDAEAWVYALAQALETRGLNVEEIEAIRARLEETGQLTPQAKGLIEAALTIPGSDLEPEGGVEAQAAVEVDLDELGRDLAGRLNGISEDLQLVAEAWLDLEPELRAALLDQLRYYSELHAYLARLR